MPFPPPFGDLVETTVRVMTWNLWWRFGPWELRRPAIAATLAAVNADVIALQEVWGVGGVSFAAELGEKLGYHHADASRLDLDGVSFGNALLSRWPIRTTSWRPLPAPADAEESRTILFAEIDGPRGAMQVYSTHLNWRFDQSHIRQDQVHAVVNFVAANRAAASAADFPPVLCGDLNAVPDAEEIRMLTGRSAVPLPKLVFHDAWDVAGDGGTGMTWCNANPFARRDLEPDRRIDYILVGWPKAGGVGHVTRCSVTATEPVGDVLPSDHYAVVAELRY